jgi:hypothetical protein
VKYCLFFLTITGALAQISTSTSYTSDLNGNRVAGPSTVTNGPQHTVITRSINGHQVPMEQSDEKVLSENANGRTVERIVKRFDPNGQLAGTDRVVIQEEKLPDGMRTRTSVFRSEVNGQPHEIERKSVEEHRQGSAQAGSTNTQTQVERPGPSGSFQVVEKATQVSETSGGGTHTDSTVYRPDGNGAFAPAVRDISETKKNGSQESTTSAHYEPRDSQQLQLIAQTVATTTKRPDGSSVSEISMYGKTGGDGRAHDNEAAPHLREIQTVQEIPGPGGSITQIVTAQRPSISDPNRLGPSTKISETVCTGVCKSGIGFMH